MALLTVSLLLAAAPAAAQDRSRSPARRGVTLEPRWEVEGHGGVSFGRTPSRGSATLPEPGAPITTTSPIFPSRQVPSWFLGDGSRLFNGVAAEFGLPERLTALDAALASPALDAAGSAAFGVRVRRVLTPRYTVEGSIDVLLGSSDLPDGLRSALEDGRQSFETAFGALLATGPFTSADVSASANTSGGSSRDVFATAAVIYDLTTRGTFVPYVTAGGGIRTQAGDLPSASLEGTYRFDIIAIFPVEEADRVTLTYEQDATWAGVVGGGVRRTLSSRWGFRVDGRAFLTPNTLRLRIDADPVAAAREPAGSIESFTAPSIQFSNNSSTGRQSTLSPPGLDGFEAFRGTGLQTRFLVTVGIFARF